MKILTGIIPLLILARIGFAQQEEVVFISPIGSVTRSAIVPGWGQFYAHSPIRGVLSLVGVSVSLGGALAAHQAFQDTYENDYLKPIEDKLIHPKSEEAAANYRRANERFKLRQFFLYTAIGVWVYSVIDSYVGASFYNATMKAASLSDEAEQMEKLGVSVGLAPTQLDLSISKSF